MNSIHKMIYEWNSNNLLKRNTAKGNAYIIFIVYLISHKHGSWTIIINVYIKLCIYYLIPCDNIIVFNVWTIKFMKKSNLIGRL